MTPIILNPTEQSLVAFLLFKPVSRAYPCPQKKHYGKRWVQYQAGVAEGSHKGHCTPRQQSCGLAGQAQSWPDQRHMHPSPSVPNSQESWQGAPAVSVQSYGFLLKWEMSLLWHRGLGSGWHMAFQEHLASLKCFTALHRDPLTGSGSEAVLQEGRLYFPFS